MINKPTIESALITTLSPAIEARFLRYVQVDTTSDDKSTAVPSTPGQLDLLYMLADELRDMGAHDVVVTGYACLLATIPATVSADVPTFALLAHVDTTAQFRGDGVKPLVHRQYDGSPIVLPDAPERVIDPSVFPYLAQKAGEDIVTASGTTLLGADDKSGVAIVMTVAEHLLQHPEIEHGAIRICFTPDEEISRGVDHLTPQDLGADVAYTLDGGELGELSYETFSADKCIVEITGVSIHPGYAKDQMVSAVHIAAAFVDRITQRVLHPAVSSGREGFIHIVKLDASEALATIDMIVRDFDLEGLYAKEAIISALCDELAGDFPRAEIDCRFIEQYRNMHLWLEHDMRPVDLARRAIESCGIDVDIHTIRGGTDGARLTAKGVPTPNLFTGMQNYHGPLEWVSVQDMARSVAVCVRLAQLYAEQAKAHNH